MNWLDERNKIKTKPITLKDCVNECYENEEFVAQFNRLNNANLKCSNSFYNEIDFATGKRKNDLLKFIEVVDTFIYKPLLNTQYHCKHPTKTRKDNGFFYCTICDEKLEKF